MFSHITAIRNFFLHARRTALLAGALAMVLMLGACKRDPSPVEPVVPVPSAKGVYIIHEGLFNQSNASLWYYDLESFAIVQDIFYAANGRSLGDVANQMVIHNNRGYIVVNNSHKIEVIDVNTNKSEGTIDAGAGKSPREMMVVNDTLGLVTNLYDNSVSAVNLKEMKVFKRILTSANPDGIALSGERAFVACSGFGGGTMVSVVSATELRETSMLTVWPNPSQVAVDENGMVYVLSIGQYNDYGNPLDDVWGAVTVIDPSVPAVVDTIHFSSHIFKIALARGGVGYVSGEDTVWQIDTRERRVVKPFVTGACYGLAVDAALGDVYITDPKNYITPGQVKIYSSQGELRTQFWVGTLPASFAFKR